MVWLFMIPSIPTAFGNFLLPIMIGAKDVAFPRLNLLSYYIYVVGALWVIIALWTGGCDTGWTFYTPVQRALAERRRPHGVRDLHPRVVDDHHRRQLHRDDPHDARQGRHLVPHAALRVGDVRRQHHPDARDARARNLAVHRRHRQLVRLGALRPGARRRPRAVPAPLLVLLAPGRLHHDPAGDGGHQRDRPHVQPQEPVVVQGHRLLHARHRVRRLRHVGAPHVRRRDVALRRCGVRRPLDARRHLQRHQGVHLGAHDAKGARSSSARRSSTSSPSSSSSSSGG